MSEAQIPAESGGERDERDEKGRFLPGNATSKKGGRPRKLDLMKATQEAAEELGVDLQAAVGKMLLQQLAKAAQGDTAAARLCCERLGLDDKHPLVTIDARTGPVAGAMEAMPEGPRESYEASTYLVLCAVRLGVELERQPRLATVLDLAGFRLERRSGPELTPPEVDRAVAEAVEATQNVVDAEVIESAPHDAPGGASIEFVGDEPREDGVQ